MKSYVLPLLLCLSKRGVHSFCPVQSGTRLSLETFAKTSKGFGQPTSSAKKPKVQSPEISAPSADIKSTSIAPEVPSEPAPNGGQKALAELRRQRAESKDAELRKVREMIQADEQVQETAAAIPEKVAQRMGKRMLPFVGLPLFLGMGTFVGFWYMATYRDMEFQPALVAASTIFVLVVSLLGITYSVMSASWDVDREGDLLGTEEFSKNLGNIKDGLSRSRENAILRDKMEGLADGEIDRALSDLDRRENAQQRKAKSLNEKLNEDMD